MVWRHSPAGRQAYMRVKVDKGWQLSTRSLAAQSSKSRAAIPAVQRLALRSACALRNSSLAHSSRVANVRPAPTAPQASSWSQRASAMWLAAASVLKAARAGAPTPALCEGSP